MTTTDPTRSRGRHRRTGRLTRAVLGLGLTGALALGATPAVPGEANAVPDEAEPAGVTVRLDPSYQGQPFEGWGTSLVWFANATGDYPDEIREELAELVFGEDGLRLNLARYNVGGGNAPDVPDYLRPGGAVEGWWQAPEGTTRDDVDWWDPADPAAWNDDADLTQRWWVDRIKDNITHWEAFSNSPPWFQTVSGYTSGGFDSTDEQIRADRVEDFAAYLVGVTERLEAAHDIEFDTVDPLNEPNTNYWGTTLGADGDPVGGRQEGAHAGPQRQGEVILALAEALAAADSGAVISAMDETNPGIFATNWYAYPEEVRDAVAQLNVHTYGTGGRPVVRDIAKGWDKPLWMSEVGGSYLEGQDFESMVPGLGIANQIVGDLRELEPTAWVFWQPVEDFDNMAPGGESELGANWGSIHVPFDCTATDTLQSCPIRTNTKFGTIRNFTHYIRPGDRLVGTDDPDTVAAVQQRRFGATAVHVNQTTEAREVTLDLSGFRLVRRGATVTPVVTDATGALQQGAPVTVRDERATLAVPAQSVTTFVVDGVRGADPRQAPIRRDAVYALDGVQSDRLLRAEGDAVVLAGDEVDQATELWRLEAVSGQGNHTGYALVNVADGRLLADTGDGVRLVAREDTVPGRAQWIGSTTGDQSWTFVNRGTTRLLEVGGEATAEGSAVTTWQANGGPQQRWVLRDASVTGVSPVTVFTPVGVVPELPATVTADTGDGAGYPVAATWRLPREQVWQRPGQVTVRGVATDLTGTRHRVEAVVVVDRLDTVEDVSLRTVPREVPALPATVPASGALGIDVLRPVVWSAVDPQQLAEPGAVVVVEGDVDAGDGRTLTARAEIEVVPGSPGVVSTAPGVEIAASFTEPGFATAGLRDGDLTDKAWSNWVPGPKRAGDTLTVTLPDPRWVRGIRAHVFPEDDTSPATARLQLRGEDGAWSEAGEELVVPAGSRVVELDVPVAEGAVRTDGVRLVMTAREGGYLVLSELEVLALVAD